MDIEVARTFLEIVKTRSFVRAAERLFVTQTTVSARIQGLEQQLDCELFIRSRSGIRLTTAGERFVDYATQLVQAWDRAREEIPISDHVSNLTVGCELSLWDPLLISWLVWMGNTRPEVALRAEVELADELIQKVERGAIDIALVYNPKYYVGMQVELLMEEKLILVTTDPGGSSDTVRYVRVGWGSDFLSKHDSVFPGLRNSSMFVGLGPLALQYVLRSGGTGYFRARAVEPYLEAGKLTRVADAPEFTYPVYIIRRTDESDTVKLALADLAHVVEQLDD